MFDEYLSRWGLVVAGDPIYTKNSRLLPVRQGCVAAMLKVAVVEEEQRGNRLVAWWRGQGTAPVLAQEGKALLMPMASGSDSLAEWSETGRDSEAARVLCSVAGRLHRRAGPPPPGVVALPEWFGALSPAAEPKGGLLALAAETGRHLLASQREIVVLHGDVHHRNVLSFDGEWLAIDPKGLWGERTFDYVNILRNPDLRTAASPERLTSRAAIICEEAGLEFDRLLQWLLAFSGLSAVWSQQEGEDPGRDFAMMRAVASVLSD